jgi:glycosyltransferase involved in cell wall biosynthesis
MTSADKICFVFFGDFMTVANGMNSRAILLLDILSKANLNVTVYSGDLNGEYPWSAQSMDLFHKRYPQFALVIDNVSLCSRIVERALWRARVLKSACGMKIKSSFLQRVTRPNLHKLKKNDNISLYIISFVWAYVRIAPDKPYIIDQHDFRFFVDLEIGERGAAVRKLSLRTLLGLKYQFQVEREAAFVISISYYEWLVSCGFYGADKAIYLSPVPDFLENTSDRIDCVQYDLGFVGAKDEKNAEGLINFLNIEYPKIPDLSFAIAGSICRDRRVVEAVGKWKSITLLDYVENIHGLYRRCRIAISPRARATGTQLKIVEGLAAGVPILTSRESMLSLPPGFEQAVMKLDAEQIRRILGNSQAYDEACLAAKAYFKKYSLLNSPRFLTDRILALLGK